MAECQASGQSGQKLTVTAARALVARAVHTGAITWGEACELQRSIDRVASHRRWDASAGLWRVVGGLCERMGGMASMAKTQVKRYQVVVDNLVECIGTRGECAVIAKRISDAWGPLCVVRVERAGVR